MAKKPVLLKIDEDVIEGFRHLAEARPGGKYQAIMHEALEAYLGKEEKQGLEARIARLEEILLKKK